MDELLGFLVVLVVVVLAFGAAVAFFVVALALTVLYGLGWALTRVVQHARALLQR